MDNILKITDKAIDGKVFEVVIKRFTVSEMEGIDCDFSNRKSWDFINADIANPKTKSKKIEDAKLLLKNMIDDYEYDNNLIQ